MAITKDKYGTEPLKNQYHKIILNRIIRATYKSNDIINIQALASEFEVSKTPIREALIELCDEGLLRSIPKFGYEVIPFQEDLIRQVLDFRYLLESSAMSNYWEILKKKETIKELYQIIEEGEEKRRGAGPLERWEDTARFHLGLSTYYNNPYLTQQLTKAMRFLGIEYSRSVWHTVNPINEYFGEKCHRNIVKQIEKDNKEAALETLRNDMENFRQLCISKHQ